MIGLLKSAGLVGYILLFFSIIGTAMALWKIYTILLWKKIGFQNENHPCNKIYNSIVRLNTKNELSIKTAVEAELSRQMNVIDKGTSVLNAIVTMSPLLGLLGTVTGMMVSFEGLSAVGGDSSIIAKGIKEALVTTAMGLTIAIYIKAFLYFIEGEINKILLSVKEIIEEALIKTEAI